MRQGKPLALMWVKGEQAGKAKVRGGKSEYGVAAWRSGAPCPARPWPELRLTPGFMPRSLGRRSYQSQFHHLGANLPLPSPPPLTPISSFSASPSPHPTIDLRGAFLTPRDNLDSTLQGSGSPTTTTQASPHPLGYPLGLPTPPHPHPQLCFPLTPDPSQLPEPGSPPHKSSTLYLRSTISPVILGLAEGCYSFSRS